MPQKHYKYYGIRGCDDYVHAECWQGYVNHYAKYDAQGNDASIAIGRYWQNRHNKYVRNDLNFFGF